MWPMQSVLFRHLGLGNPVHMTDERQLPRVRSQSCLRSDKMYLGVYLRWMPFLDLIECSLWRRCTPFPVSELVSGSNTSTLQCRLIGLVSPESTPHQNDRASRFTSTYTLILLAIDAPPDTITSATMDIRLSISVSPPQVLLSPSPNPLPAEAPHPSTSMSLPPEAIYSSKEELYKVIQVFAV